VGLEPLGQPVVLVHCYLPRSPSVITVTDRTPPR
jgi:hypothetical protein